MAARHSTGSLAQAHFRPNVANEVYTVHRRCSPSLRRADRFIREVFLPIFKRCILVARLARPATRRILVFIFRAPRSPTTISVTLFVRLSVTRPRPDARSYFAESNPAP